tara:strand:- start:952 stop:2763 length:1812 start_codon:yes stop_codon:yes gene_type:complete
MSYWNNGEEPPVKQTQTSIPSANGLSYSGGQRIDLHIPSTIELFSGRDSYLQFKVKILPVGGGGATRLQLDPKLGGQSLIKNIRIYENGASGKLLEEIQDYNCKVGVQYSYDADDSLKAMRALKEGCLTDCPDNRGTLGTSISNLVNTKYNPYYKPKTIDPSLIGGQGGEFGAADFLEVKCCLPLHTGIFADALQAFPNFLFEGGLRVEIDLEEAPRVVKQLDSVNRHRRVAQNPVFYGIDQNGTDWTNNNAFTQEIYLDTDNNITSVGNCPFVVGERLGICDITDQTAVANFEENAAGNAPAYPTIEQIDTNAGYVRLTLDQPYRNPAGSIDITSGTNFVVYSTVIDSDVGVAGLGARASYNVEVEVSDVELVVQSLELDPSEKSKMMSELREGGAMEFDCLSATNYKHSLNSGNRQATINLPISNTRAKAMIIVPTDSTFYTSAQLVGSIGTYVEEQKEGDNVNLIHDVILNSAQSGYGGIIDNLTEYQFNIDDKLTPSRPVDVSKAILGRGVSAQQLNELDKALNVSRIVPRSFADFNRNFVIGRAYALGDGVSNLQNRTNQIQLSYNQTDPPEKDKMLNCFVFHLRRIVVRNNNVDVLL